MDTLFLNEQRCACGKLLLKGIFFDGTLEIKCKKCGAINKIGTTKFNDDKNHYQLMINEKGIIINASSSSCKILGYSHEEMIGMDFAKINPIMPKEINDRFFCSESTLDEDNYFQLDTIHQTKEGKKIPVIVLIKLYHLTNKERFFLVSVEVKNINNIDNKISKSEDLKYLKNLCDYFFVLDKNGIIDYINPSVQNFLVFPQEAVIGKNYFECIPIGDRNESKKLFEHFSKLEQPYKTEDTACLSTNGKTIHTELFFTPNFNDGGKFIGYRVLVWATRIS